MIKEKNERIVITLSKVQAKLLRQFCQLHEITLSTLIKWILTYNADELLKKLNCDSEEYELLEELLKSLEVNHKYRYIRKKD